MRSFYIHTLLFLSILAFASCKKDDNPVNPSLIDKQILPLKTGNTWVIRATLFDTTGTTMWTIYDTLVVGKDSLFGSETWYQFTDKTIFFTNKSDGLWRMKTGSSPIAPALFFKYPANVGDSWTIPLENSTTYQVSVYANDISVTVPQGTYSCYQYRFLNNSKLVEDNFLSPGVGLIAFDEYSKTNSGQPYRSARLELVSVIIK